MTSCTALSATCGRPPDGCGGQLPLCGVCTTPMTCSPSFRCVPANPEQQVRAIQAAADGIVGGGPASIDLPVDGIVVTALKPVVSGADPVADAPGFFVQAGSAGLFVEVSTATPPPAIGNVVSFRVTSVAKELGQRRAKAISNYSRLMVSGALPAPVGLSTLNTPQLRAAAESTLVRVNMQSVTAGFDAGTGYGDVAFGSGIAVVRLPATLNATEDLRGGCSLTAEGPLWRTMEQRDQVHVWTSAQLGATTCQPPSFVQATSPDAGVLVIETDRFMAAGASPTEFRIVYRGQAVPSPPPFPPFPVVLAAPQRFILNGPWVRGVEYELSASLTGGPRDTRGSPALNLPVLPFVAGGCTNTAPLAISTVFPGTSVQYIELHNRTTGPISLSGWRLIVRTTSGNTTINLPAQVVGAGQYFLVSDGSIADDYTFASMNLSPTGTAVGLGQGISQACSLATPFDWVSIGTPSGGCQTQVNASGMSNIGYRRVDLRGCVDTDSAQDWLSLTNPAPRRLTSQAEVCLCQ